MSENKQTKSLTHVDAEGKARMVDVSGKEETLRRAVAEAAIDLPEAAYAALRENRLQKGDALAVARLAGIMAAKKTSDWIPLCHPLRLDHVELNFSCDDESQRVLIRAKTTTRGPTGVEMEAMVAAAAAALTIYDMTKGVARDARIHQVRLLEKSGGKSGTFLADDR